MPYTPPNGNDVNFVFGGTYTAPNGGTTLFDFGAIPPASPSLSLPSGRRQFVFEEADWQPPRPRFFSNQHLLTHCKRQLINM